MTSVPRKHTGSALQRAGGQGIERRTQGIPLRGLVAKWTCEAGGSLLRASAGNWLPLGWSKPGSAPTQLSLITSSECWRNPPRRPPQDIPLSSSRFLHSQELTGTFSLLFFLELFRQIIKKATGSAGFRGHKKVGLWATLHQEDASAGAMSDGVAVREENSSACVNSM